MRLVKVEFIFMDAKASNLYRTQHLMLRENELEQVAQREILHSAIYHRSLELIAFNFSFSRLRFGNCSSFMQIARALQAAKKNAI